MNLNTRIGKIRLGCIIAFVIGFSLFIYGIIIKNANYSFEIKFNGESFGFFEDETLHFLDDVDVEIVEKDFKISLNGNKVKNEFKLTATNNNVVIKKYFNKITIPIKIERDHVLYVVDENDNVIHNYLSNNKSFKIISDKEIVVNNSIYNGELFTEFGNYFVECEGKEYNINILNY